MDSLSSISAIRPTPPSEAPMSQAFSPRETTWTKRLDPRCVLARILRSLSRTSAGLPILRRKYTTPYTAAATTKSAIRVLIMAQRDDGALRVWVGDPSSSNVSVVSSTAGAATAACAPVTAAGAGAFWANTETQHAESRTAAATRAKFSFPLPYQDREVLIGGHFTPYPTFFP